MKSKTRHARLPGQKRGTHTKEFHTWRGIRRRCTDQRFISYKYYGGRGITVCPRWANSFAAFVEDMGRAPSPNHSIERINSNGNYEPSNCRWATPAEQSNNKGNNRRLKVGDETLTLQQWSTGHPAEVVETHDSFIFIPVVVKG